MTSPSSHPSPTPQEVNRFHAKSDVDSSKVAQHHTLGFQANQSSPGDHIHDGKTSKQIGAGLDTGFPTLADASYNQTQMQAVLDALVDLGFGS